IAVFQHDKDWRGNAAEALGAIGPDARAAVPILCAALEGPCRDEAAVALVKIGRETKAALPVLLAAVRRTSVSNDVVKAVGLLGPAAKDAVPDLLRIMDDDRPFGKRAAVEALGCIGPAAREALPVLHKALRAEDGSIFEKDAVALALAQIS